MKSRTVRMCAETCPNHGADSEAMCRVADSNDNALADTSTIRNQTELFKAGSRRAAPPQGPLSTCVAAMQHAG